MSIVRRDYIERMIEQLAQALATLLFGRKKPPEEVKETLAEVTQRLLGMEYRVLVSVDAQSAASLLGEPLKIEILARLIEAEAETLEDTDPDLALTRRFRALDLLRIAEGLPGAHHPEAARRLTDLAARLEPS
ncbi:MAG TPA: hypothetical protein VK013_16045 [Myxococcaceae bacterium]|nr:hypothetical protein [Myxococcaceae bacterium]